MRNSSKVVLNALIGLVLVCFTLIVFFVGLHNNEKTAYTYYSLGFVLFAEVIFTFSIIYLALAPKENVTVLNTGIISVSFLYLLLTVLTSLLFRTVFGDHIGAFISTHFALISLTTIIVIGLILAYAKIKSDSDCDKNPAIVMRECENKVFELRNCVSVHGNTGLRGFYSKLNTLYEEFKYSDTTNSIQEYEVELENKVQELKDYVDSISADSEFDAQKTDSLINELVNLLKCRSNKIKQSI